MKKNVILIISPHPNFGGASTANKNIADILSINNKVIYLDEYFSDTEQCHSFIVDKYSIHHGFWHKNGKFLRHILSLKPNKILIGVPVFSVYYFFVFLICRYLGISIGIIFHSLSLKQDIKGRLLDCLIAITSLCAKSLIFVSNYTKQTWSKSFFIRFQKNKHVVVYNAVREYGASKYRDKVECIGFVARLSEEKNPDFFCKIARCSYEKKFPYKFLVFGDGPLFNECKSKYHDFVSFKGYCSDMDSIYSAIDLLVLTSDFENCPMTILEAKVRGIPCVAPRVGGIPEIVQDGIDGLLYIQKDCELDILNYIQNIDKNYSIYVNNSLLNSEKYVFVTTFKMWENIKW